MMAAACKIKKRITIAAVTCTAAMTTGCGVFPFDKPAPDLFVLTPKSSFSANLPNVDWQLTVELPLADAGINTSRIAIRKSSVTIDYYQGANWIDTAPRMVQTLLVESFENTNQIVGVGRQSAALRADYTLLMELREFQAEQTAGEALPSAHVRLNAKLVRLPQRTIVATKNADFSIKAKNGGLSEVVRAFDDALGKALKTIVEWALTAVPPKLHNRPRPRRR
jgi:cholesterol transport system auxiliary component